MPGCVVTGLALIFSTAFSVRRVELRAAVAVIATRREVRCAVGRTGEDSVSDPINT